MVTFTRDAKVAVSEGKGRCAEDSSEFKVPAAILRLCIGSLYSGIAQDWAIYLIDPFIQGPRRWRHATRSVPWVTMT